MKQMDVFKKIGGILKELNDQYDYLKAESSDLNELELELFVANAHFLKDHAEILRRLHERNTPQVQLQLPPAEPEPVVEQPKPVVAPPVYKSEVLHEQRFFEPVVQQTPIPEARLEIAKDPEPVVYNFETPAKPEVPTPEPVIEQPVAQIDLEEESTGDSYSFEREEPEMIQQELVLDEATTDEQKAVGIEPLIELAQAEEPQQVIELTAEPEKPVVPSELFTPVVTKPADNNDGKVLTLNQKMSAQRSEKENAVSGQPVALPITDLKSAINLNDKLLYIKDLFNGYSLAYSEAIEIVNRFNTFEEAERFLKTNYIVKNNWESKPATSQKFFTLLRRRYPV
ncbi:hypothetical protein SAMN05216464_102234 [Mucilaginibacter pineti]|uniref:Uncharacterized protein n=1 Tax=Mucilaginibacter pineti TaxID=1391627 RepID=A0A1G6WM56_9SPHI|nr:hypothetical protein [Mucilaginibacter pineti]SDD66972.1 hypothetical protein SAMN05216464_102234 [Mucilaginibacter pineti]